MKKSFARVLVGLAMAAAILMLNPITKSKPVFAQASSSAPHCRLVGGTVMTNFGAVDQNTTMGTAKGDLRGAVSGTLLGAPQPGTGNTLVFHVQRFSRSSPIPSISPGARVSSRERLET